jgi:ABC-type transporter Mla MlaB component
MLRITKQSPPNDRTTLVLEGRLVGPWVAELRRAVEEVGSEAALDLAGVTFADTDGVAALRALRAAGASLLGASGFLTALIGVDDGADRTVG